MARRSRRDFSPDPTSYLFSNYPACWNFFAVVGRSGWFLSHVRLREGVIGQWLYARFDELKAHLAVAQVVGRTVSFFLFDQGDPQALVRAGKARMPPVGA